MIVDYSRPGRAAIDNVLAACGGGPVLHVGPDAGVMARAWRARGVIATGIEVDGPVDPTWRLPVPDRSHALVAAYGILDARPAEARDAMFDELLRVSRGPVLVTASGQCREAWERWALGRGCRKDPRHQLLVPYDGLDWQAGASAMLFERLPDDIAVGRSLEELAAGRDLHMDMLREAGRRADAHVGRYMFARRYVRPGDRVLDAACGLGYGSAILMRTTLASSVTGADIDAGAIAYARDHYGRGSGAPVFETRDLAELSDLPSDSFDLVVSFETLEHIADPERFLAACRRLLTPGGRIVCSVPNEWVDEHGVDPNPHHLHVFTRPSLERLCRSHVFIEDIYGQTAGGGMKLGDARRALWRSTAADEPSEWWLLVGMKDPAAPSRAGLTDAFRVRPADDRTHALAFERDYENPWLVRAMVTMGLRTDNADLLASLASRTGAVASPDSSDAGAALCVALYRTLESGVPADASLLARVDAYCRLATMVPHVIRWQVSLGYVLGLYWLQAGDPERAAQAFEQTARSDELKFSPLLSTKTVGAAFFAGWLAVQRDDRTSARHWWTVGVERAERSLHQPWDQFLLSRTAPVLFGLREATLVVDLASQCASGLHLLDRTVSRPGLLAAELYHSLTARLERQTVLGAEARREADEDRAALDALVNRFRATQLLDQDEPLSPALGIGIFGTGAGGRRALERLRARGARIVCFSDNDPSRVGTTIDGVPVVAATDLKATGADLVAVASLPGKAAIFQQLLGLGYEFGRDFDAVT